MVKLQLEQEEGLIPQPIEEVKAAGTAAVKAPTLGALDSLMGGLTLAVTGKAELAKD